MSFLTTALHNGSPWLLLACLMILAGVVIGLFTEAGSGIASHPFTRPNGGGELASDLPPASIGRAEFEPILWGHPHPPKRHRAAERPAHEHSAVRVTPLPGTR